MDTNKPADPEKIEALFRERKSTGELNDDIILKMYNEISSNIHSASEQVMIPGENVTKNDKNLTRLSNYLLYYKLIIDIFIKDKGTSKITEPFLKDESELINLSPLELLAYYYSDKFRRNMTEVGQERIDLALQTMLNFFVKKKDILHFPLYYEDFQDPSKYIMNILTFKYRANSGRVGTQLTPDQKRAKYMEDLHYDFFEKLLKHQLYIDAIDILRMSELWYYPHTFETPESGNEIMSRSDYRTLNTRFVRLWMDPIIKGELIKKIKEKIVDPNLEFHEKLLAVISSHYSHTVGKTLRGGKLSRPKKRKTRRRK